MRETENEERTLFRAEPVKIYATSIMKAARHFWCAKSTARVLAIADALQSLPEAAAVTLLGPEGAPIGVIVRESLFALLGKNYGREVLGRCAAEEVCARASVLDCDAGLFSVAGEILRDGNPDAGENRFFPLVDAGGRFAGTVSSRDLAEHLSRMTRADIDLAGVLQERLVAFDEDVEGRGWRLEAWSRPAKGVGGDLCFARLLEDGRRFIALVDVSGKGVAASIVVSMVWGMMRMHDFRQGIRGMVRELNDAIVQTFQMEKYLTGIFMVFDPASGRLSFADMGHSHAMLMKDGRPRRLRGLRANLPVGVELEIEPAVHSIRLEGGDGFLVYSDGISEQEDSASSEYGEKRVALAAVRASRSGRSLKDILPADLDRFRGRAPQQDDMSFVLVSIEGEGNDGARLAPAAVARHRRSETYSLEGAFIG